MGGWGGGACVCVCVRVCSSRWGGKHATSPPQAFHFSLLLFLVWYAVASPRVDCLEEAQKGTRASRCRA